MAPCPPARDELERILERSRAQNARADVTGLLLHCNATFMQVLPPVPPGSSRKLLAE